MVSQPEIMKTLTTVQAIGMARRTKMNLLISCCVQNDRDGEVNEDSGVFILHDKWVGFPYIQKYCKKRRLWKDGSVLSVALCSSRLWKILITLLKMYFRSVASWLESTVVKGWKLIFMIQAVILFFIVCLIHFILYSNMLSDKHVYETRTQCKNAPR